MPRHDVAIYSPFSGSLYDAEGMRGGGAERQMVLLARALAALGIRVGHIVYRPRVAVPLPQTLSLVVRRPYAGERRLGPLREAAAVWRSLSEADAKVVIVRAASPAVGVAALWCRLHRRRFVFSSANDADFTFETMSDHWYRAPLYRLGLRLADLVVVQSQEQEAAARRVLGQAKDIVAIPSFAEPVTDPPSSRPRDRFVWVGRVVDYKDPFRLLDLARELPEAPFVMVATLERTEGEPLLASLEEAAASLPNLELREPMRYGDLTELIAGAAAVVNTSRLEGMPNVFLEAWGHGTPVLTLRVDPDGVVAREGLGVAAAGSWDRFVEGARRLWDERARESDFGGRARAYVAAAHGPERVGAAWHDALLGRRD